MPTRESSFQVLRYGGRTGLDLDVQDRREREPTAELELAVEHPPADDVYFVVELDGSTASGPSPSIEITAAAATQRLVAHAARPWTCVAPAAAFDGVRLRIELAAVDGPVRLVAITAHHGRAAWLCTIQAEYDRGCRARDELFDRGVQALADRGELLDKVQVTLGHLDALSGRGDFAVPALRRFLDDPYVRARDAGRLVFDEDYYRDHAAELHDGRVIRAIREWHERLERFHLAVVKLGNRAFLDRGGHRPEVHGADPLMQLLDGISVSPRKLRRLKERNDLLNTMELLLRRERLESIVPSLEIEMSSFCNYACVMCGRSWHSFQFARQTDEQLLRLLPIMPYLRHVTIAGVGENTTSDRLGAFARMTEVFGVETRIFTNGSLIHTQLEALARFSKVCVSFDGGTAETFESQRRGASFDRVVRNVGMLRKAAPKKELAFSVVVSRLNLLELPRIAELAGELGVDHVAFSPVWHDSPLQLRPSDREVFERVVAQAKVIAKKRGVVIQVNVIPEDFAVAKDTPLDRQNVLEFANGLDLPSLHVPSWDDLAGTFAGLEFAYHPDAAIWPGQRWPDVRVRDAPAAPAQLRSTPGYSFDFDLDAALVRAEAAIARARAELKARGREQIEIPYCLSIWKYTYIRANGKHRLCPQSFTDVGHGGKDGFVGTMNGDKNRHFRSTMFGGALEHDCKKCLDPYRRWSHDRVVEQVRKLRLKPLDRTRYSVTQE